MIEPTASGGHERKPQAYFCEETLDDLMRRVIQEIRDRGTQIVPSRGQATELTGVLLEISNPRARLSRSETRGKLFSCLGELCWYLARTNDLGFISYYISRYREEAEGAVIHGGYGPRLFSFRGQNQLANVTNLLRRNPDSRRAVVQLFDAEDLAQNHKDVPCTCSLQFLVRDGSLQLITSMRSNDVFLGLPHDVFCFTMIQELIARELALELGSYKHVVGSLHLYKVNTDDALAFLEEGWQSTDQPMPSMPSDDPWPSVNAILQLERELRLDEGLDSATLQSLNPYWGDLVRLLQVFAISKKKERVDVAELTSQMSSEIYAPFIRARIGAMSS